MNTVAGRIVSMESGRGVADVTVTALAERIENEYGLAHRRLGSTLTDQDGRFRIDYEPPDAAPDWELVTLATAGRDCEQDAVLARCPRRGPAPVESIMLRIPDGALVDADLAVPGAAPQAAGVIAAEADARAYANALAADRRRLLAVGLNAARTTRKQTEKKFDRFITGLSDAAGGRGERRYAPKDTPVSEAVLTAMRDGLTNSIHQLGLDNHRVFTASEIASLRAQFPDLKNVDAAAVDQINPAGKKVLPIGLQWFDPLWACRRQTPINDCVALLDPNHPQPQDNPADGPAADQPADEPGTGDPAPQPAADTSIDGLITRLTASLSAPESSVLVGIRPGLGDVQAGVDGFALRSGPADVPATHDFHHLRIAFESVWQELFDRETLATGRQLYDKFVELGLDPNDYLVEHNGHSGYSVVPPWLKGNLLQAMLESLYSGGYGGSTATGGPPPEVTQWFYLTDREWSVLNPQHRSTLTSLGTQLNTLSQKSSELQDLTKTLPLFKELFTQIMRAEVESLDRQMRILQNRGARVVKYAKELAQAPREFEKLHELLSALEKSLKEPYRFNVYAAGPTGRSINFGVLETYRQQWTPLTYQVGELVRTVPLAPKETRKYSRKTVRKQNRAQKESTSRLESLRSESSVTARVEAEIIARAETKSNFHVGAAAGISLGVTLKGTTSFGQNAAQLSQETKKEFRESVFKAAAEYRTENRVEVEVGQTYEFAEEESGELTNPNDELPVTFLFYELQRKYRIDEKLRKVTPVILVAQEFPAPDEIDDDWIVAHDWILRRVILDDSFVPAMNYLATKVVGDEHALQQLYENLQQQRRIADELSEELVLVRAQLDSRYEALQRSLRARADTIQQESDEGLLESGHEFLFGGDDPDAEAMKAREDATRDAYQRVLTREHDLQERLTRETTAVAELSDKYTAQLSDHLNRRTQISRLRTHIKANIMHYMQAVYSHEPPDQRYFRLRDVRVPRLVGKKTYTITTDPDAVPLPPTWRKPHKLTARVHIDTEDMGFDALGDVADLDNPLGFKGNYMIFPLTRENALTDYMLTPYYNPFTGLHDPDQLATWTLHEFAEYVCCVRANTDDRTFALLLPGLIETYRRLKERANDDNELVVPTGSLYIEALPGVHPLLEDFKLAHRAVDVKKAQAEVRLSELENLRMAARLLADEHDDPRVDKKIVIEGAPAVAIDPDTI
ncbi:carboxypeptidase-like regulatory domain-containing protein [Nocardia brasiliensis]|uniref:carboxypeptidase-like regulatory domain-containing protein n=1 Tax=Nocardia brasiliensis TaxID=37326 RepID=UPI001895041B|nr:carboxypeptidase-like regulatory domain-containing protein [Nocardia brasiliensis]MBF6542598.1 hypothetical protein [Nocardia brasiliensis]